MDKKCYFVIEEGSFEVMEERNPGPEDGAVCAPAQLPALGQAGSWQSGFVERHQGCEPPGQVLAQGVKFGRQHT